jgi:hypothetical protein
MPFKIDDKISDQDVFWTSFSHEALWPHTRAPWPLFQTSEIRDEMLITGLHMQAFLSFSVSEPIGSSRTGRWKAAMNNMM